jgi:hypothetical protein
MSKPYLHPLIDTFTANDHHCTHTNVKRTELRAATIVVFVDCEDCGRALFVDGRAV